MVQLSYPNFLNSDFGRWLDERLNADQADVVHDLLAYLAEQMIAMNKGKQAEVKGFLTWLERHIGAQVETLSNKTKIKQYHDGDFDALLDVLRQNRKKLKVDFTTRAVQEAIEREFNASMAKLTPLKARLAATDRLIDLIVYRLYGLTEESERPLVEVQGKPLSETIIEERR